MLVHLLSVIFFFQAEDGIRDGHVTGVQTCALPILEMGPMRMGNTLMGATSPLLGGDAGDVYYPLYLINGKPANDPQTFAAKQIGRASCRERVWNSERDVALKEKYVEDKAGRTQRIL